MASNAIDSRANGAGTGGTGSANSPNQAGHADEVRGRARRHTSSCLPTSTWTGTRRQGPFIPASVTAAIDTRTAQFVPSLRTRSRTS